MQPSANNLASNAEDIIFEKKFIDFARDNVCVFDLSAGDELKEFFLMTQLIRGNAKLGVKSILADFDREPVEVQALQENVERLYAKMGDKKPVDANDICNSGNMVSVDYRVLFPNQSQAIEDGMIEFRESLEDNRHVIEMTEQADPGPEKKHILCYGAGHTPAQQKLVANIGKTSSVTGMHSCLEHYKVNRSKLIDDMGEEVFHSYAHYIIAEDFIMPPATRILHRHANNMRLASASP